MTDDHEPQVSAEDGGPPDPGPDPGTGWTPAGQQHDNRHFVSDYFRMERWEIPPPAGSDAPPAFGGRAPVDAHLRNAAGGLRTGGLLTVVDSLGGFTSGIAVLPEWIVTTSIMASVHRLDHRGPLVLTSRVLRRGRTAVVTAIDAVDEGDGNAPVAHVVMTCAVLDPGAMDLGFHRPFSLPMLEPDPAAPVPEEFFRIRPGTGPVTRLDLADHLRNPWGILHGGAVAVLADVAACRAAEGDGPDGPDTWSAADTVLHYLRPVKVGPVEARCQVLGGRGNRRLVRVAVHDVGAEDRLVTLGTVTVVGA
jgi:uncharacterized protein (TIGR00369 family)